jgi:hypothetical protein
MLMLEVFWYVMLCHWVNGSWRFEGILFFDHLTLKMKALLSFKLLGTTCPTTGRHTTGE